MTGAVTTRAVCKPTRIVNEYWLAVMTSVALTTVRKGVASDYLALLGIDQYTSSHTERRAAIGDALARGECLVAESEGTPSGYAVLNYTFFGFGFIPVVVVSPLHRRRGVGLRLLREAQAQCTSQKLFISANSSNTAAQSLFRKAGFVPSGSIQNLDQSDPEVVYFYAKRT